jgi:hypothetical protein
MDLGTPPSFGWNTLAAIMGSISGIFSQGKWIRLEKDWGPFFALTQSMEQPPLTVLRRQQMEVEIPSFFGPIRLAWALVPRRLMRVGPRYGLKRYVLGQ